jgi:hypothetical protein
MVDTDVRSDKDCWEVIEKAAGDEQVFCGLIRKLTRAEMVAFGVFLADAKLHVCEPWSGPTIAGIGILSEDATSDLADWVVSQGETYWLSILDTYDDDDDNGTGLNPATEQALANAFEQYAKARGQAGFLHLSGRLYTTWCERFDPDAFYDAIADHS